MDSCTENGYVKVIFTNRYGDFQFFTLDSEDIVRDFRERLKMLSLSILYIGFEGETVKPVVVWTEESAERAAFNSLHWIPSSTLEILRET